MKRAAGTRARQRLSESNNEREITTMKKEQGIRDKGQGRRKFWDMTHPAKRIAALAIAYERCRQWALADRMKLRLLATAKRPITHDDRDSLRQVGRQAREYFADLTKAVRNAGGAHE